MVRDAQLTDFLARDENLRAMHPELQAEIQFGLDNSEAADANSLEFLGSFIAPDADWIDADADIRERATEWSQQPIASAGDLHEATRFEVHCWHALWRGDLRRAME